MKTAVDILLEARDLVGQGWCQRAGAVNVAGAQTFTLADDAVRFCIVGAIDRANGRDRAGDNWSSAIHFIECAIGNDSMSIALWNDADGRTQAEVYDMLDRAAKLAKEAQDRLPL